MSEKKYIACKDCKFYAVNNDGKYSAEIHKCINPKFSTPFIDFLDGVEYDDLLLKRPSIYTARTELFMCGISATEFKRK